MKKIVSILLVTFFTISICCTNLPVNAASVSKYKSKVKSALDCVGEYGGGYGFLYDFDKNGIKELVIYQTLATDLSSTDLYFSVYTIKKNKVIAIEKNKGFHYGGGASHGGVGIAKKNGKRFLVTYTDLGSGDVDPNANRSIKIKFYKISGTKIKIAKTASFYATGNNGTYPVEFKSRVYKISGKKVSYTKFKKWLKSYDFKKIKLLARKDWKYYTFTGKAQDLSALYRSL